MTCIADYCSSTGLEVLQLSRGMAEVKQESRRSQMLTKGGKDHDCPLQLIRYADI